MRSLFRSPSLVEAKGWRRRAFEEGERRKSFKAEMEEVEVTGQERDTLAFLLSLLLFNALFVLPVHVFR